MDGGVWANCPVLVGVTEAVAFLGQKLEDIHVLSIGTTSAPFSVAAKVEASALDWNIGMLDLMFEAQAEAALAQAKLLLNHRLHRLNATVPGGIYSLDGAQPELIEQLVVLGRGEAVKAQNLEPIRRHLLNGHKAEAFVPTAAVKAR